MSEMYKAGAAHYDQVMRDVTAGRNPSAPFAKTAICQTCEGTGVVQVHFSAHEDLCPSCQSGNPSETKTQPGPLQGAGD